ncbi:hypothetical protein OL330_004644 [Vibrio parahaemolyticus]|uniref:hypothetical protein n=1 Tax=Vibrio parahaemolyticus TaxID=670 RepID=UPI002361AF6A|nr:hypothetical protein [Vibrio parahaemolyticus]EKA7375338.1 hypothetical protein [Vibrio parahaemolyticus]ELA9378141.1 hypothetical protein [Vibrio parahaemolyticus]ELK8488333.1 hypothetical protein [Vibrio parahaemolyticus]
MKLSDVIEEIDTFDEESTIFVESGRKISGRSESEVIYLSDEELAEDIAIVAEKRCKGKSYFLEVSIVIELKYSQA